MDKVHGQGLNPAVILLCPDSVSATAKKITGLKR